MTAEPDIAAAPPAPAVRIVRFDAPPPPAESAMPAADRIVSGRPAQLAWNHYSDPTGQFHAGIWQGEPGAWRVRYEPHEEELCTLVEGHVRLTDGAGVVQEFAAGATFVVPGGFTGIWENVTRVRKIYALGTLQAQPAGNDDGR